MSEWIKCSERLPILGQRLSDKLVVEGREIPALNISVEVITFNGERVSSNNINWFDDLHPHAGVTHWMPLPQPPEDE